MLVGANAYTEMKRVKVRGWTVHPQFVKEPQDHDKPYDIAIIEVIGVGTLRLSVMFRPCKAWLSHGRA